MPSSGKVSSSCWSAVFSWPNRVFMSFALDGCGKSEHWSIQVVLENELQLELSGWPCNIITWCNITCIIIHMNPYDDLWCMLDLCAGFVCWICVLDLYAGYMLDLLPRPNRHLSLAVTGKIRQVSQRFMLKIAEWYSGAEWNLLKSLIFWISWELQLSIFWGSGMMPRLIFAFHTASHCGSCRA